MLLIGSCVAERFIIIDSLVNIVFHRIPSQTRSGCSIDLLQSPCSSYKRGEWCPTGIVPPPIVFLQGFRLTLQGDMLQGALFYVLAVSVC